MTVSKQTTAGEKFRKAVAEEKPLQVIGTICAYHAVMAKRVGYRAIYLSGAGVAAGSLGMPPMSASCRCWSTSTPDSARAPSTSRAQSGR